MTPPFFTWNRSPGEAKYCNREEAWIKTSGSCLKIPYTNRTLNCLPPVHDLVLLSVQMHQGDILGSQEKKRRRKKRDMAIPNNAETPCSLQFNNLLWQLLLPAGVGSRVLSIHVQCVHHTYLYLYRRQLLPIMATCETRGEALKIKELQSRLEANLGFIDREAFDRWSLQKKRP